MASPVCLNVLTSGAICRARTRRTEQGRVQADGSKVALVFCPTCGIRRQVTRDDGASAKRYIPRER